MEMKSKQYNHGFIEGEQIIYCGKQYTVEEETPSYVYAIGHDGEKYRIWSKQLIEKVVEANA